MNCLKCPYCQKKAAPFLKTYFWGYFPGNRPNVCQNCSKPIKYNLNYYFQCGALVLVLLIALGFFVDPLFSIFERNTNTSSPVTEVLGFDFIGLIGQLLEIGFVFFILYISFELPAKYFGLRIFKKSN
ncbi:MAG TPA: hypothetical protein VMW89_07805 [Desulfatiglandales bacterium]|nr:hypothetical protein [Desulfatiglandales bacterium]